MPLTLSFRSIALISALALNAVAAQAQTDDAAAAAERAAAVEEARAAFEALAEESLAQAAAEAEAAAAEERAAAVAQAQAAFEALAEESLQAAIAEQEAAALEAAEAAAAAERAAAVAAANDAFAALAEERAAREAAEAEAARLAAEVAEAEAAAERAAAVAAANDAFAALAAESAARAEAEAAARAALEQCVSIAGEPSAEAPISAADQQAGFEALRAALPFCRDAAQALPDEGAPFFHLATAAQLSERHRRAVPLYETAAENGVAAALTRLGDYYNFGIRPVREDLDRAVELYREASAAGDIAGTATLAFMYRLGRGVPRDPAEMVRLMQEAADGGYPFAQFNLGQTFLYGEGIQGGSNEALGIPDARRAVPLLAAAARAGNVEAAQDLIGLYSNGGPGVEPSPFLRFRWTDFLAETGDPAAIAARAFLYEQGIGRDRNPQLAAEEYIRALETGEVSVVTMRGAAAPPWDGETARAFQTILQERGYYQLAIDGAVGPGTRAAAEALQDDAVGN